MDKIRKLSKFININEILQYRFLYRIIEKLSKYLHCNTEIDRVKIRIVVAGYITYLAYLTTHAPTQFQKIHPGIRVVWWGDLASVHHPHYH